MKYYLDKFHASHYVHRVTLACYHCVGILYRTSVIKLWAWPELSVPSFNVVRI